MSEPEEHSRAWDRWAGVYDTWFGRDDPVPAAACLATLSGHGAALELGVGTGRVALELARHGVRVDGVDHSAAMIDQLRSKAKAAGLPVRGMVRAMDDLPDDRKYSLVYVTLSTFFGLLTQESQVSCFRQVAQILEPGGSFLLECFNPIASNIMGREFTDPRRAVSIRSLGDEHVGLSITLADLATQVIRFQEVRLDHKGITLLPMQLRFAWPSELDLMARLSQLELASRFDGWDARKYDGGRSFNHISVYRRAGAA